MPAPPPGLPMAVAVPVSRAAGGTAEAGPADVTISHHDGAAVLDDLAVWADVYEQVYRGVATLDHADPPITDRLARHARRPGFTLVGARAGDRAVGFVYGYPLPPDTFWWDGLEPEPSSTLIRERTLGVCEGLMLPPWRQLGFTGRMYGELLNGRAEERLAVHIAHDNDLMLSLVARRGAIHVGDLHPFPGWRRHAAYVIPLRPTTATPNS